MKQLTHLFNQKYAPLALLLKEFDAPFCVSRARLILLEEGIILDLIRPSLKRPKEFSHFWVLSGKGLPYGRNIPSETHPIETTMVFYRDNFQQLIDSVFKKHINPYPIAT